MSEAVSAPHTKASLITYENNKLRTRYAEYLKVRELPPGGSDISIADTIAEITTDDERIVLYYILHENVRKVSKSTISSWLNKCEIRGVNVDNAFDLLSSFDNGALNNDTLEFGIDTFRKYSANVARVLPPLKKCVDQHIELAVNIFKKIWSDDTLDINIRLFVAYIVEERMRTFGDRWMAEGEIENITQWESPTVMTFRLIPGVVIVCAAGPLFPAATTTTYPASHAASTPRTSAESSLIPFGVKEPTDILIIRIPYWLPFWRTQRSPASTSDTYPFPL